MLQSKKETGEINFNNTFFFTLYNQNFIILDIIM